METTGERSEGLVVVEVVLEEDLRGVKVLNVVEVGFWVLKEKDNSLEVLKAKGFLLRVERDEAAAVVGVYLRVAIGVRKFGISEDCSIFEGDGGERRVCFLSGIKRWKNRIFCHVARGLKRTLIFLPFQQTTAKLPGRRCAVSYHRLVLGPWSKVLAI